MESVINYGLAMIGSHASLQECQEIDKATMNPAARRITGTGYTTRRESLHIMADTRPMVNHYLLKSANMIDRIMRAGGTNAEKNLKRFLREYFVLNEEQKEFIRNNSKDTSGNEIMSQIEIARYITGNL